MVSIQPVQQQKLSPASVILSISLTPPLSSRYTNHNQDQKLKYPFDIISPQTASNNTDLSPHPSLDNTGQMTNPRPDTETANSPNSVLETPCENNYSTHTTFVPNFDP
ncbi:hypothetical protein BY996DRAFT_6513705 [Phakopsora pachyrhizi]|nr:hypothetical protein BY996DRAFT_6513705 [Phakopsora pachyrhizi]